MKIELKVIDLMRDRRTVGQRQSLATTDQGAIDLAVERKWHARISTWDRRKRIVEARHHKIALEARREYRTIALERMAAKRSAAQS